MAAVQNFDLLGATAPPETPPAPPETPPAPPAPPEAVVSSFVVESTSELQFAPGASPSELNFVPPEAPADQHAQSGYRPVTGAEIKDYVRAKEMGLGGRPTKAEVRAFLDSKE